MHLLCILTKTDIDICIKHKMLDYYKINELLALMSLSQTKF